MGLFSNILGSKNYKWKFIENGNGPEYSLDSTDVETFKMLEYSLCIPHTNVFPLEI